MRFYENGVELPRGLIVVSDRSFYRTNVNLESYTPADPEIDPAVQFQGAQFQLFGQCVE